MSGHRLVLGAKTVAVIRLKFPDYSTETLSPTDIDVKMQAMADFLFANSFGLASIASWTNFGYFMMPNALQSYPGHLSTAGDGTWVPANTTPIHDTGASVAQANGVNLAAYDLVIFVYTGLSVYGETGGAYVHLSSANGFKDKTIAHEALGHSLGGLYHGASLTYPNGQWTGRDLVNHWANGGIPTGYGDFLSPMGVPPDGPVPCFNAYHKNVMGWIGDANVQEVRADSVVPPGNPSLHKGARPKASWLIGNSEIGSLPPSEIENAIAIKVPLESGCAYWLEKRNAGFLLYLVTPNDGWWETFLLRNAGPGAGGGGFLAMGVRIIDPYRGITFMPTGDNGVSGAIEIGFQAPAVQGFTARGAAIGAAAGVL